MLHLYTSFFLFGAALYFIIVLKTERNIKLKLAFTEALLSKATSVQLPRLRSSMRHLIAALWIVRGIGVLVLATMFFFLRLLGVFH